MSGAWLQHGVLHSALGSDVAQALRHISHGRPPVPRTFAVHESAQVRPWLAACQGPQALEPRLGALVHATLDGTRAGDCLLIIASTGLDIALMEQRAGAARGFDPDHLTPLDRLAGQLRQRFGFADAFTLNTACTSAANALLYGARLLGHAAQAFARVLVLAFEPPSALTRQGFAALELISPSGYCRPFDARSDGLIPGECYCAALLTRSPGPRPLARLLGGCSACDTHSLTGTAADGSHLARVMRRALADADVRAGNIGLLKLHGTGTIASDQAEIAGLRQIYPPGAATPPLVALKPWLGHTMGACGLSELLLLFAILHSGTHLPARPLEAGTHAGQPQDALLPLSALPLPAPVTGPVMANFFGFGGNNASLILQACPTC